jgi:Xaa-Pro dipeptidase
MRQQRLARLAYAMQERGITQVIISEDRNLYYYLGQYEESMERLRILLVDDRGGCRCYANELFDIPADSSIEVIRHSDGDESRALRELAENLVRGGQIAVDKEWPSGFLLELIAFAGNRKFIPAGELLRAPMICKDETEQILMRESCRINDLVMEALLSSIDESSTEAGLSRSVHALYDRYGAQGTAGGALVAFGKNCANAHPKSKEICPQMGNCILIDMGAPYCYYQSDMTRTVFFEMLIRKWKKSIP